MLSAEVQAELIAFTQDVIRAYSLSGKEDQVAGVITQKMHNLKYDKVEVDAYGSVIGYRQGAHPGPTILFDSHMDVVPITNTDEWLHNPLAAEIADGKIWGRGASDMKGSLAACVVSLGRLSADQFNGTLVVSTTVGEEIHEGIALSKVIEHVHPDFVVICEPNGCCLGIGQKGRAGITINVMGKPAHSSVPHLGDNAMYKAVEIIQRLRRMALPKDPILGDGIMELIDGISTPYPSQSTLPVKFSMRYDRRLMQGETLESVRQSVNEALEGIDDWSMVFPDVEIHTYTNQVLKDVDFHPGWLINRESPWIKKAARGLNKAGIEPQYTTARFCTNGSFSAGVMGIPTMIFGPSSGMLAHCINEHIEINELIQGANGYTSLASELTGD